MLKTTTTLALGLIVAGMAAGCDAQQWAGSVKGRMQAPPAAEQRLSPAFSQSGRVEAKVLTQMGPMPQR